MGHPRKSPEMLPPVLRQRHSNQQDEILQPTCADHEDGTLTPVELAVEKGLTLRRPVTTESVDLQHASGGVLAQPLNAQAPNNSGKLFLLSKVEGFVVVNPGYGDVEPGDLAGWFAL